MANRRAAAMPSSPAVAARAGTLALPARLVTALVLGVAMLTFAGLCLHQVTLPGLYYDEAFDAVPAMQLLAGQPVELLRGVGLRLFGRDLPVMIGDYWGVVSTYAVLPLLALLGPGVLPVRLWPIAAGVLAIPLTYALGARLYGRPVGLLAAGLLAVSPSFVLWSRVGIYVISHIVAVALGIFLAYLQWRAGGRRRWLALAALLAGIGLSTKLLFIWFLLAVPAGYALVLASDWLAAGRPAPHRWLPGRLHADLPLRSPLDAALALAAFALGAFPVLYYNAVSLGSWRVLRANLLRTERGVDNFALLDNARVQADALRVLLDGGYFWFYGGIETNAAMPWAVGAATLALLALLLLGAGDAAWRRATLFLLGYGGAIWVLSWFTVSILGATHLLILLPIPQLFLAAGLCLGLRRLADRLGGRAAQLLAAPLTAGLLLAPLAAAELGTTLRYHGHLTRTGGHTTFSDAIYTLAGDLEAGGVARPYALDWGFRYNLMLLSGGRVEPREIFGPGREAGPEFEAALRAALAEPRPVFLARPDEDAAYPRLAAFRRGVAAAGRRLVEDRLYRQRDGRPAFHLLRVG